MRAVFGLLAMGLCSQAALGKVQVSFDGVVPANEENVHRAKFNDGLRQATVAGNVHELNVEPSGEHELQSFNAFEQSAHRQLAIVKVRVRIKNAPPNTTLEVKVKITKSDGSTFEKEVEVTTDANGEATAEIEIDDSFLNGDKTDVCETCTLEEEEVECPATGCDDDVTATILGDPHMVGLLGQKIDWAGVDGAWYCLLSDGPDFHVNVRLSAPMPKEFPDRQLISAVSILSDDGLHSLVVEVKNPYSTDTDGCLMDASAPCLANGGLRILVDGEESGGLHAPAENVYLPGSFPLVVSAANLPAECRPFGGDRIWATQYADMMANHRNLRSDSVSFGEWILQPDTLAAPTWCARFLDEGGDAGLLSTQSKHATFRVQTPVAGVRINVGVNYQDLETAPDGTVLVPELEFWQTDIGFDGLQLSDTVAGLMGDTSRFVLDDEGLPVTSGLGALHGPVESYRVTGPFAQDFEKLNG